MGTAPTLEDDLAKIKNHSLYDFCAVGVDCATRYMGRIQHAVSYHPNEFKIFKAERSKAGGNVDYQEHSHCMPELGHRMWPYFTPSASSAMLGVEVGIGLGYDKIIVAGVDLNTQPYARFRKGWLVRYNTIKDKVRAMSGFPLSLLGPVTDEWLNDTPVITITTGWSGDAVYCLEDVNKVYRGIKRNTTLPFNFILYAGAEARVLGRLNGLEKGIKVIPSAYPSWWVSMQGADPDNRPWIKTDAIFGLGLDCVVVGNIDDLLLYPSELASMKDYPSCYRCPAGHEDDCNLEVTLIRNDADRPIWNEYVRIGKPTWDASKPPLNRVWPLCAQGWINTTHALHVDLFPENWVASYKYACRDKGLPAGCKIVSFHGKPKPGDVSDAWVKEHWL